MSREPRTCRPAAGPPPARVSRLLLLLALATVVPLACGSRTAGRVDPAVSSGSAPDPGRSEPGGAQRAWTDGRRVGGEPSITSELVATTAPAAEPQSSMERAAAEDVSVDELLAAAETALGIAGERVAAGDSDGYRVAMAEVLSYLDEAQGRLAADPTTFPLLKGAYVRLLARLRDSLDPSLDPSEIEEDVLAASADELADTRAEVNTNGADYEMAIRSDSPMVQKYLALYQKGKRREYIQAAFERSGRYRELILEEIRARGLPEELWVVPVVESGYKTSAYSRARAVGIWQFMASTARKYGLVVNEWVDERRDPAKSTKAALAYLEDLFLWFNDWDFALAAYNRGEYGMQRDIHNSGIVDFMEMAELGATHRETGNHVPQIHAAAIIAKNPDKYGFRFEFESPEVTDTVVIDYVVDLEVAARCAGATEKQIRELNPELRTWVTPLLSKSYPTFALKLPRGSRGRYQGEIAKIADKTPKRRITYVVRRGDTLGSIGRRFGVSWHKIRSWNNLRSTRIYPGQKLQIFPGKGGRVASAGSGTRRSSTGGRRYAATTVSEGGTTRRVYRVRRGDTLTHIARAFGVTVKELQTWNGVGSRIYPGQRLEIVGAGGDGNPPGGEPIIYVVKRGDTLSRIAEVHGTSVADLRNWNDFGRYLHPGQRIKIYLASN